MDLQGLGRAKAAKPLGFNKSRFGSPHAAMKRGNRFPRILGRVRHAWHLSFGTVSLHVSCP
jgi:hypothetical protein